jgi:hypothetical protein
MNASIDPTPQPALPEPRASTVGRELLFGLLGVLIALACVLPPLVHLVTGPLGPFIGGFIAANQVKPGPRGRAIIACTIGAGLAGLGAAVATAVLVLGDPPPNWFPSKDTLSLILGGVFVYGTTLAAIGAAVSSAIARKESAP